MDHEIFREIYLRYEGLAMVTQRLEVSFDEWPEPESWANYGWTWGKDGSIADLLFSFKMVVI